METQASHPHFYKESELSNEWASFHYTSPPPDGLYWLAVNEIEYEVDVDAYGRTIGMASGKVETRVCMAFVSELEGGGIVFDEVNGGELGRAPSDESIVTHYMPATIPPAPT